MVILYSYRVKNNAYEMKFIQYMCSECIDFVQLVSEIKFVE